MAKKIKKPVKAKAPSKSWGIVRLLKSNQFKYTLGLFLMILCGYTTVAFISYIYTGELDQSKLSLGWSLFTDTSVKVHNFAGKGGAFLSEFFINEEFGFPSFFFIV